MNLFYSDVFPLPLPNGHSFPISKYELLRFQLIQDNVISKENLRLSPAASDDQLLLVHHPDYVSRVVNGTLSEKEIRRIGFPWTPELVERSRRSVGGTIAACQVALQDGIGVNLAGGTHHAYPDHGEGYCVFNDVAVAVRDIQKNHIAASVVILDLDVHQGNGTAVIFQDDPNVFTLSIHGEKNFPFHKESGDLDIALADGTGDTEYIQTVEEGVMTALSSSRADIAIYLAGADPYEEDRLGRLAVTKNGLLERDSMVIDACRDSGLPLAIVLSGGYARNINDTVDIHFQTIRLAVNKFQENENDSV